MFRTLPLSIIRSFSLYKQQWYMSYSFADSLWAGSWSSVWNSHGMLQGGFWAGRGLKADMHTKQNTNSIPIYCLLFISVVHSCTWRHITQNNSDCLHHLFHILYLRIKVHILSWLELIILFKYVYSIIITTKWSWNLYNIYLLHTYPVTHIVYEAWSP